MNETQLSLPISPEVAKAWLNLFLPYLDESVQNAVKDAMRQYHIQLEKDAKSRERYKADEVKHYTRKQTAQKLLCSLTTVDKYANKGKLTRVYVGRRILFSKEEVDALLETRDI